MDQDFARRRQELMERIGPGAVAILHGGREARRNSDVTHRYRQPSDLLYLTGFEEPEALAVLAPGRDQPFTMFVRPRDPEKETWTGRRLGVEGAITRLGADAAWPIGELRDKLRDLVDGARELHYYLADDPELDRLVADILRELRGGERRGKVMPPRLVDLRLTLHEMRLRKDAAALALVRRAVAITVEAHVAAMQAARPGAREYELEALVDYTFRRRGAAGPGYATIVGAGANGTVLHYTENESEIGAGDLVLVDAGAEYRGFTADITRTWPAGGRFTPAQRRLYEAVLEVQLDCIAMARPGATIDGIHERAVAGLTAAMVGLGLLAGEVPELIKSEAYKKFYPHRTSHWLGMDVHDVGAYYVDGASRALEPGMIITVEPGLYVPLDAAGVPDELRGLAVRIEDDVLITAEPEGHEVLTREAPKTVEEIERVMARDR